MDTSHLVESRQAACGCLSAGGGRGRAALTLTRSGKLTVSPEGSSPFLLLEILLLFFASLFTNGCHVCDSSHSIPELMG